MKFAKTILTTGLLLALAGCQSTPEEPKQVSSTNKEEQQDNSFAIYESIKGQYESWLTKLQEAKELKIYSKSQYSKLLKEWAEVVDVYEDVADDPAKVTKSYSVFSSGTYAGKFNEYLTKVDNRYGKLLELKTVADEVLAEAQEQMSYLDEIKAIEFYSSDYKRLSSQYGELYEEVEDGDIDDAQADQVVFLNNAKKLEEKVVLKQFVDPLKAELTSLRRQDFDDVAAISYAKAKAEIAATEQVVRANTRDVDVIRQAVVEAQFELDHVKHVALEVKKLASVKSDKFEPVVLDYENKLLTLSKMASDSDYRDSTIREQAESILADIETLKSQLETAQLNHTDSVNLLTDENGELKKKLNDKEAEIKLSKADNEVVGQQLKQAQAQILTLEGMIEMYKSQLEQATATETAQPSTDSQEEVTPAKDEVEAATQETKSAGEDPTNEEKVTESSSENVETETVKEAVQESSETTLPAANE